MRVAYVSHSLVDSRQARFADALEHALHPGDLFEVYPERWVNLTREGGYEVSLLHQGAMSFRFEDQAWRDIREYDPDVLLLQDEPGSWVAHKARSYCEGRDTRLVVFTWENLHAFEDLGGSVRTLEMADYVVCGNPGAQERVQAAPLTETPPNRILPQVGVDVNHFHPMPEKEAAWDVYVTGRPDDPMKAVDDVVRATKDQDWSVVTRRDLPFVDHDELPERYNRARVVARPSKDVPNRPREQFLPSSTAEAIACGTPVVTSNQDAVKYWAMDRWDDPCPAVWHHEEGDVEDLERTLAEVLEYVERDHHAYGAEGRKWVADRLSNEAVAAMYRDVLEEVVA